MRETGQPPVVLKLRAIVYVDKTTVLLLNQITPSRDGETFSTCDT